MIDLKNKSARELRILAKKCNTLADDLQKKQPSYSLAIENGVVDAGYNTTANGYIKSYNGETTITLDDGSVWKDVGHKSSGNAYYADDGYIEFIPI